MCYISYIMIFFVFYLLCMDILYVLSLTYWYFVFYCLHIVFLYDLSLTYWYYFLPPTYWYIMCPVSYIWISYVSSLSYLIIFCIFCLLHKDIWYVLSFAYIYSVSYISHIQLISTYQLNIKMVHVLSLCEGMKSIRIIIRISNKTYNNSFANRYQLTENEYQK